MKQIIIVSIYSNKYSIQFSDDKAKNGAIIIFQGQWLRFVLYIRGGDLKTKVINYSYLAI